MDAKALFFASLEHFKDRNKYVIPQLQLQKGRNERWFAREMALAMNQHLTGTQTPSELAVYADCEEDYADVSVWETGPNIERTRTLAYEIKTLYRSLDWTRKAPETVDLIVARAREQLARAPLENSRTLAIFWIIYDRRVDVVDELDVRTFTSGVRDSIRHGFKSDHDIRLTELCPRSAIRFWPTGLWHTESWITWGEPR